MWRYLDTYASRPPFVHSWPCPPRCPSSAASPGLFPAKFSFSLSINLIHMQTRRSTRVSPLAIVLPHPPLPHRRSSRLSANSAPQTPRSCGSPSIFFPSSNRKSTDSWNSSNADDMEYDWKPEQVLLLSRVSIFFPPLSLASYSPSTDFRRPSRSSRHSL